MNVEARMTISREEGDPTKLIVAGEIDAYSSPELERALDAVAHHEVHVDMSAVTFIDSTGLRALVRADSQARRGDRTLSVVAASDAVMRLLRLTALDGRLQIEPLLE